MGQHVPHTDLFGGPSRYNWSNDVSCHLRCCVKGSVCCFVGRGWSLYSISSCTDVDLHRVHLDFRRLHERLHLSIDRLSHCSRQFGVTVHRIPNWIRHVTDHATEPRTADRHFHRERYADAARPYRISIVNTLQIYRIRTWPFSSFVEQTWQRFGHCCADLCMHADDIWPEISSTVV